MALKINSASGSITLTAEDGSGNADVTIPRDGIVSDLSDLSITATAAEINKLDGVTATTAELNYVDGVTSNIQTQLDAKGTVSTLADLSVTATAAELNLLDGVTATTTELNYVDGVTSNIQTQLDAKGTVSTLADLSVTATAAELNLLDGVTATTTELNYVDGVTSAIQTQIDGKLASSLKGAANGVAELDSSGLVPTSQLPSYVDDVLEYANASSFPGTGDTGKIYVALDTNDIYRWSGSAYVKVSDAVSTADQATALATARTISLSGDVTGSTSFDGSANVSITATIADDSHNHVISNVDGLQTALDGKLADTSDTLTGTLTIAGSTAEKIILQGSVNPFIRWQEGTTSKAYVQWNSTGYLEFVNVEDNSAIRLRDNPTFTADGSTHYTIWHGGNDGASSGLDADMLDGLHASTFLRGDVDDAVSGVMEFGNSILIEEVVEKVATSATTSGTINFDVRNAAINNYSTNQTANRTINFRASSSQSLNAFLDTGKSVTVTALMQQGSTAYYLNAYQVDGSAVTPKWSGGSAPTGGNASGIDVYTFTIIKTANATFTVLASVTQYA